MARIKVTDSKGEPAGWFDPGKAFVLNEHQRHDGYNAISEATNTKDVHESLYLTASGQWILQNWSDYQGTSEAFEAVNEEEAVRWLLTNQYEANELKHLPKQKQDELLEALSQYEL